MYIIFYLNWYTHTKSSNKNHIPNGVVTDITPSKLEASSGTSYLVMLTQHCNRLLYYLKILTKSHGLKIIKVYSTVLNRLVGMVLVESLICTSASRKVKC